MPRKPQSPTKRREALEATAGRAAQEKDERVVADTNLANTNNSQDTALTNVQNTNASQNTNLGDLGMRLGKLETLNTNQTSLLQSHTADIVALGTRITNQENVNSAQQTNITGLVNFQNRAAGFATEGHLHDERYYGRGQTDTLFLRHASHPLGPQLHGSGYHA